MRGKIIYLFLILTAFACKSKKDQAGAPGSGGSGGGFNNGPLNVEAIVVNPTTISEKIEATGTIIPNESTEIRPETSGRITNLNIKEGNTVQAGTLLAKLFDGDLIAQLKKLEVQLKIAEKTEERQRELLKIGGVAQQDYDLTVLNISNIKADIELVKVNISKTEIRAPYTGRIGLKYISPGAYVTPSTLLTIITQVHQMKIEYSVPEKYSTQIRNGEMVRFRIEGSSKDYEATVIARESKVDELTRNLKIRALVKGEDPYLVPGTFARVNMILGENKNALMIPTSAIIPQARNKEVAIYKNGIAEFKKVITGIRDSSNIQIIDGLDKGDTVITSGLLFVKPESKIKLTKIIN